MGSPKLAKWLAEFEIGQPIPEENALCGRQSAILT